MFYLDVRDDGFISPAVTIDVFTSTAKEAIFSADLVPAVQLLEWPDLTRNRTEFCPCVVPKVHPNGKWIFSVSKVHKDGKRNFTVPEVHPNGKSSFAVPEV